MKADPISGAVLSCTPGTIGGAGTATTHVFRSVPLRTTLLSPKNAQKCRHDQSFPLLYLLSFDFEAHSDTFLVSQSVAQVRKSSAVRKKLKRSVGTSAAPALA